MIKEAKKSLENNITDKLTSPFWGAFVISWLIWNWKIWYVTVFIDSDLLLQEKGLLKMDYIYSLYKSDIIFDLFISFLRLIILPFLSAWFFIFIFPLITHRFYEKSLESDNENKIAKNRKDEEYFKTVGKKLEAEKEVIMQEASINEEKMKIEKTQEEKWDEEYSEFEKTKYFNDFNMIIESIYQHFGKTEWDYDFNGMPGKFVSSDVKAYADTNNLIEIDNNIGNKETIKLTEKGKYFMKKRSDKVGR